MLRKRKSSCSFLLVALLLCACSYAAQKSAGGSQLAAPQLFLPLDGTQIAGFDGPPRLSLSWIATLHASGYRLQICKDATCTTILVDAKRQEAWYPLTSAPQNATVFWRVCAVDSAGNGGAWCAARRITFGYPERAGLMAPMSISDEHVIGVVPLAPRKDTRMLCLDWYNYDQHQSPGLGCTDAPVGGHPWNDSHVPAAHFCAHEMGGCWLVATEMLNHYRGHNLTFDEMKFHESGGGPPEGDFPHGLGYGGGGGTDAQTLDVLTWALNLSTSQLNASTTMLTEAQARAFVAAYRPIYFLQTFADGSRHASIIDGYHVNGTTFEVHNLNTDNDGTCRWVSLDSLRSTFQRYYCPDAGTTGRNTDPSISTDSDGDGMVDFDEINRFHTDPHDWDSDHDGISDMNDVHGPLLGNYGAPVPTNPDIDGDGLRAELDFDSDNGGVPDGYEDRNVDGMWDVGETNPFYGADDPTVASNLTLANMTISTKQTYLARNSVTIAPATTVTGSADVIFAAGNTITINSGFQTSNGVKMKVWRDPHLQ